MTETENDFIFYSNTLGGWAWKDPIESHANVARGPFESKIEALRDMNTTGIVLESASRQAMNRMRDETTG